jgi:hypothetical protein
MAPKGRRETPRRGEGRDRDPHRGHDHDGHEDHDRDEGDGDDPARHAAVIARRWLGSVPPSAELYARARQQWLALPGATVRPAAEVQLPTPPAAATPNPGDGEGAL